MFKSQRRFGKVTKNENVRKSVHNTIEVEEVYNSKTKRLQPPHFGDKNRTNRCTIIKPSCKDFGQFTEVLQSPNTYKNAFREEFGIAPIIPETIEKLKELKKIICRSETKLENASSYDTATGKSKVNLIEISSDEAQWQNVENTSDLYKYIPRDHMTNVPSRKKFANKQVEVTSTEDKIVPRKDVNLGTSINEMLSREDKIVPSLEDIAPTKEVKVAEELLEKKPPTQPSPTRIRISEVPRIKVMAEKFSMFKKNNIELRRLEEKVVCLEYDVFDQDAETGKPFQRMRAFFSIKSQKGKEDGRDDIAMIPSEVKRDYDIVEEDLNKLNKKEIEIIDENLPENRSLLEDLKKVLRRNPVLRHKKEGSLDLMYLYEMAKRQNLPLGEEYLHNNVLSKEELDEIKEMILKKSVSSIHGISRRKVKNRNTQGDVKDSEVCEISNSLIMELMREVKVDKA